MSDRLSSSVNKQPMELYELNTSRLLEVRFRIKKRSTKIVCLIKRQALFLGSLVNMILEDPSSNVQVSVVKI